MFAWHWELALQDTVLSFIGVVIVLKARYFKKINYFHNDIK